MLLSVSSKVFCKIILAREDEGFSWWQTSGWASWTSQGEILLWPDCYTQDYRGADLGIEHRALSVFLKILKKAFDSVDRKVLWMIFVHLASLRKSWGWSGSFTMASKQGFCMMMMMMIWQNPKPECWGPPGVPAQPPSLSIGAGRGISSSTWW